MRKKRILALAILMLGICFVHLCFAAVPHLLNYQGKLTDAVGTPLNGSYSLTFRLYDAESVGNMLWEETQSGVVIQKGIFNVLLGSVTALNLAFDKQYYLEIKVGTEVMSPRQRITSAGYAIRAEKAEYASKAAEIDNLSGLHVAASSGQANIAADALNTSTGASFRLLRNGVWKGYMYLNNAVDDNIYFGVPGHDPVMTMASSGNIGIGIASPPNFFSVFGSVSSDYVGYIKNSNSTNPGGLKVFTPNASSGLALDVESLAGHILTVLGGGLVGIGTASPAHPLHMKSGAFCSAAGQWTNASDIAYKKNIIDLKYGLRETLKLQPREFDIKQDGSHQIGFIAQEMEKVIPEVVSGKEGQKGISYGTITAVLVNAIKEQQKQIESLEARNSEFQAKLNALAAKLNSK